MLQPYPYQTNIIYLFKIAFPIIYGFKHYLFLFQRVGKWRWASAGPRIVALVNGQQAVVSIKVIGAGFVEVAWQCFFFFNSIAEGVVGKAGAAQGDFEAGRREIDQGLRLGQQDGAADQVVISAPACSVEDVENGQTNTPAR